jgi:hypothetical protein
MINTRKDEELRKGLTDREGQYRWTGRPKSGENSNKGREKTQNAKKGRCSENYKDTRRGG